ncbi:MAG: hypothetical protein FD174_2815 [Geobacteraceae bacterium]|nr:MAG: hypothetical protein FD174_2815 [Geobacteraceae bacterium]
MKKAIYAILLVTALAVPAAASEGPSLERGKALFEDGKLGTSGKSCATCHQGGRKLEWAATYEEEKLAGIINNCVKQALKGKPLDPDSDDMKSMVMYIKTFAGPGR